MAITFLDPTYPNRLPALDETLDFVVSSGKVGFTLSLRYASGRMETIYQDGIVGVGYSVSIESDNQTFHVSRMGGWPLGRFSLPMTEKENATDLGNWTLMYEKDLRSLPNQAISSTSEYKEFTLDGKPWASHIGSGGSTALVNGQGLRLSAAPGSFKQAGLPYGGTLAMIRTRDWAGLDITKEIAIAFRFGGTTDTSDYTSPYEAGACTYSGARSWGLGGNGAECFSANPVFGGDVGTTQAVSLQINLGVLETINMTVANNSSTMDKWSWAVSACPYDAGSSRHPKANMRSVWWNVDVPTTLGGHASPATMMSLYSLNGVGAGQNDDWMLGAYVGNRAVTPTRSVYITHVRVLQRSL